MLCNISQNAMGQTPGGGTLPGPAGGGVHCWVQPDGYPAGGVPCQGGYPAGGYPVRTTGGVLTTRRAVCLLRSRRRTFLLNLVHVLI